VEDSRVLSKVFEQRLAPFFRVEIAHDGEEAIRLLGDTRYAAMVLDLVLPKVDGFEVLRAMQRMGKTVPVVIATAKPRSAVESEAREYGVESILSKPLDYAVLVDMLQQAISSTSANSVEEAEVNKASGKKYPFRIARRCCYI
jgi:DNA-binding response OmpR family regulator